MSGKGKAFGKHRAGVMNSTEVFYSSILELQRANGTIKDWWFEAMTFKLAEGTKYTPDFMVQMPDDTIEYHETKSYWRDDAKVKIKIAADKYPFVFKALMHKGKKFEEVDFTVR